MASPVFLVLYNRFGLVCTRCSSSIDQHVLVRKLSTVSCVLERKGCYIAWSMCCFGRRFLLWNRGSCKCPTANAHIDICANRLCVFVFFLFSQQLSYDRPLREQGDGQQDSGTRRLVVGWAGFFQGDGRKEPLTMTAGVATGNLVISLYRIV